MANYLAIFVTALAGYAIGALWYSPLLFGNQWMRLSGYSAKDMQKAQKDGKMGLRYGVMFLSTLIMSWVLSMFISMTGGATFLAGLITGFWLWLGFLATTMLGMVLWNNKPVTLYLLMTAHYLVALCIMGGILAVWA